MTPRRRDEIARGLAATRERIDRACAASDRPPADVTLVVVTKRRPAADIAVLYELGVRHVGENVHQEAVAKVGKCAELGLHGLTWHFVGNLQSNKAQAVAGYADVVHSVDRVKLLRGLSRGAKDRGRDLDVLLQVDLEAIPRGGRGGVRPEQVAALAAQIRDAEGLALRGVMTVAPQGEDPLAAFSRLAVCAGDVRRVEPGATWLSAGMSADLEAGVLAGATHVRVGSAILGTRAPGR